MTKNIFLRLTIILFLKLKRQARDELAMLDVLKAFLYRFLIDQILFYFHIEFSRDSILTIHPPQKPYFGVDSPVALVNGENDVADLADVVCYHYRADDLYEGDNHCFFNYCRGKITIANRCHCCACPIERP